MAETVLSRRGFMGHIGGAYVLASGVGVAAVAVHDPMLDLVTRYRDASSIFEDRSVGLSGDEAYALADETYSPLFEKLRDETPSISTDEGAIEALRCALAECDMGAMPFEVLRKVEEYLAVRFA